MDPQTLAVGRDLALVLLVVEAFVLALPLLIVPFLILRYLPRIREPIRPNLAIVRQKTEQAERLTKAVMDTAVLPLLWTSALAAGLRRSLEYMARRR